MRNLALVPMLIVLCACSGALGSSEPGPITDEQFAALKDECSMADAQLSTGDRSVSFKTEDGIPVNGTIEADSEGSKTVILGKKRSKKQMFNLIRCIAEFQESTGAEFSTDAGAAGFDL